MYTPHHIKKHDKIRSTASSAVTEVKWHIVRGNKKISLLWNNYLRWWTEGGLRECSQQWPYLSPLPFLSVIGSGLMNDRGGQRGVREWTEPASKVAQARTMWGRQETAVCKLPKGGEWWVGGGKGGCTRTEHEGAGGGYALAVWWDRDVFERRVKVGARSTGGRFCCWQPAPMNMYVSLFTCTKDGPPG